MQKAIIIHKLKFSAHSIFGAWSLLLIHAQFTPSKMPKGS